MNVADFFHHPTNNEGAKVGSNEGSLGFDSARVGDDKDGHMKSAVMAAMERVKQLPSNSAYALHRLRVLNKILALLSIHPQARTTSEAEELEILFAGLSI